MCLLASLFRLLVHGQVLMALSAVCYVQIAGILLGGGAVSRSWSVAAFLGTLGIYVLDSLRSADREDPISQPDRARIFRRHRGAALGLGLLSLATGFVFLLRSSPPLVTWIPLGILALTATCYLVPLVPLPSRVVTLKDFSIAKPLVISLAWFAGALIAGGEPLVESGSFPRWSTVLAFGAMTIPVLVLDSVWLDRRDRRADLAYGHPTFASQVGGPGFLLARLALWSFPWLVLLARPSWLVPCLAIQLGSAPMLALEPERIRSESGRVVLASFWRFAGCGALLATLR